MKDAVQKTRNFGIGLCMAGIAALGATHLPIVRGACTGSCAQCSACGFTALPVVVLLVEKRWKLTAKIRHLLIHPMARLHGMRAVGHSCTGKVS